MDRSARVLWCLSCAVAAGTLALQAGGTEADVAQGPADPDVVSREEARSPCSQLTRFQVDIFELLGTGEQVLQVNAERLLGEAEGRDGLATTPREMLEALREHGEARLLLRIDNRQDLARRSQLAQSKRLPTTQDFGMTRGGEVSRRTTYEQLGTIVGFEGQWRPGRESPVAHLKCQIEASTLSETGIGTDHDISPPAFHEMVINQMVRVESGRPVVFVNTDLPQPGVDDDRLVALVVRLVATQIHPGEAH